jgi:hypothetical protein
VTSQYAARRKQRHENPGTDWAAQGSCPIETARAGVHVSNTTLSVNSECRAVRKRIHKPNPTSLLTRRVVGSSTTRGAKLSSSTYSHARWLTARPSGYPYCFEELSSLLVSRLRGAKGWRAKRNAVPPQIVNSNRPRLRRSRWREKLGSDYGPLRVWSRTRFGKLRPAALWRFLPG